ncbi:MAG: DUF6115 domain-containing protein [Candidatus Pristimantibacillus sp.]
MDNWSYIVLVGAVVLVCALLVPRKQSTSTDSNSNQAVRNMEVALEQFMENMELDNQELVKLVTSLKEEGRTQSEVKEQRISVLEQRIAVLEQLLEQQRQEIKDVSVQSSSIAYTAAATEIAPFVEQSLEPIQVQASQTIQSRYSELLQLYNEGKSIEAIAKKLNMNKGEVQLILQLAKQEEGARA